MSTVVMVVTARKVRLVLKVSLVQRVPRVYKVWLAHAENVVTMAMTVLQVSPVPKVLLVIVGCLVSKVTPGLVVSTVLMVVTAQKV